MLLSQLFQTLPVQLLMNNCTWLFFVSLGVMMNAQFNIRVVYFRWPFNLFRFGVLNFIFGVDAFRGLGLAAFGAFNVFIFYISFYFV